MSRLSIMISILFRYSERCPTKESCYWKASAILKPTFIFWISFRRPQSCHSRKWLCTQILKRSLNPSICKIWMWMLMLKRRWTSLLWTSIKDKPSRMLLLKMFRLSRVHQGQGKLSLVRKLHNSCLKCFRKIITKQQGSRLVLSSWLASPITRLTNSLKKFLSTPKIL
jgi:hypothetical protein